VATENRDPSANENPAPQPAAGQPSSAPATGLSSRGASRRRFARMGAGATGVVLTLHSQPGMACTYCGISASAALSAYGQARQFGKIGTLSHHGPAAQCNGIRPSDWVNVNWPAGCKPTDAFGDHFACKYNSEYAKKTCMEIMKGASCDSSKMGQYIMAAYLNILSKRIDFLTVQSLHEVWGEWVSHGYYAPMAGQRWYANDIVGYLYGTMD